MHSEKRRNQWKEFARRKTEQLKSDPDAFLEAKLKKREYDREYRAKNREKRRAYNKDRERMNRWNAMNREKYKLLRAKPRLLLTPEERLARYKAYQAKYKLENPNAQKLYKLKNPEKIRQLSKNYYSKNKQKIIKQNGSITARRRLVDPAFKIQLSCYSRIGHLIRGKYKSASTMKLVGCTRDELKSHLESQFRDGMTWENYGKFGWHIDHIRPCSRFDLTLPEEQRVCFHYSNLQPLWSLDNIRKGNKLPHELPASQPQKS